MEEEIVNNNTVPFDTITDTVESTIDSIFEDIDSIELESSSENVTTETPTKKKTSNTKESFNKNYYSSSNIAKFNKRFKDAPWINVGIKATITIGGVGGIGSNLAFILGRMGYPLRLYDFDEVSIDNIGVQMFSNKQVFKNKTTAIEEIIEEFSHPLLPNSIRRSSSRITDTTLPDFVSISCFDNMEARKILFNSWKTQVSKYSKINGDINVPCIFIDGRMTAETFQIFAVTRPSQIEKYEKTLFSDDLIPDLPCSYKSTPHNSLMIACFMTSILNNYYFNYSIKDDIREVPFSTSMQQAALTLIIKDTYD